MNANKLHTVLEHHLRDHFMLPEGWLTLKSRKPERLHAYQCYVYLMKINSGISQNRISKLTDRDHSSISHTMDRMFNFMTAPPEDDPRLEFMETFCETFGCEMYPKPDINQVFFNRFLKRSLKTLSRKTDDTQVRSLCDKLLKVV